MLRKRGELFAPAIVLTGRQTAGRGRGDHRWWSGPGCLTATFALPIDERVAAHQVPLVAGLAVRNAAAELTGSDALKLKWPNDVLIEDHSGLRKVGGLLCERVSKVDLIGVGLNVNLDPRSAPPGLRGRVASLAEAANGPLDMTEALASVAGHLRRTLARLADHPFAALLAEYDEHHALIGRTISVIAAPGEPPVCGKCQGLDPIGRLVLKSRSKTHHVIAGQVSVV